MNETGRPQSPENGRSLARALGVVGGYPDIKRLSLPHRRVKRAHRFLKRRFGIEAMRIENIDIVETHSRQALIEASEKRFAAAEFSIGARPHGVTRLRRNNEFVA